MGVTAYEIGHCDWSSDVCSSDLTEMLGGLLHRIGGKVAMGGGSLGKGPLAAEGEDGPAKGGGWEVA